MLPESQHSGIYNSVAVISWEGTKVEGPYVVTLRNMFDDELTKFTTPETTVQIDLTDPKYAAENAIFIDVTSQADPKQTSKRHLIKKLSPAEQEKIKVNLNEIMGEIDRLTGRTPKAVD